MTNLEKIANKLLHAARPNPSEWMKQAGMPAEFGVFRLFFVDDKKKYALYLAPNTVENSMVLDRSTKKFRPPTDDEVSSSSKVPTRKPSNIPFSPSMVSDKAKLYQLGVRLHEDGFVEYRLRPENAVGSSASLSEKKFNDVSSAVKELSKLKPREFLKGFDGHARK